MTIVMKIFALLVYKLTFFFKTPTQNITKALSANTGMIARASCQVSSSHRSFVPFSSLNPFGKLYAMCIIYRKQPFLYNTRSFLDPTNSLFLYKFPALVRIYPMNNAVLLSALF